MCRYTLAVLLCCLLWAAQPAWLPAQAIDGLLEPFALSEDRREVLDDLIPGTQEYFYYHCLHYQNQKMTAEARAILDAWQAKYGKTAAVESMRARQFLIAYDLHPQQTLDYLKRELGLNLHHPTPARDRAAHLPTSFDNTRIALDKLMGATLAEDPSLERFESHALVQLLDMPLTDQQLRALLSRLQRADHPALVGRILEELRLKDTQGFGWAEVHNLLTLKQLEELVAGRGELLQDENFIRAYTARLSPREGVTVSDSQELQAYLQRLRTWTQRLPPSQNNLKALVLVNLLRFNLSQNQFDRDLFLEYLKLPRPAAYYNQQRLSARGIRLVELDFQLTPQIPLPAIGDDASLVLRYLEHFLQAASDVDAFADYLDRDFLERAFAATKLLYGIGNPPTWYSKLSAAEQQELRDRTEMRFVPHNQLGYPITEPVRLDVELKNVSSLTVKIYEINTVVWHRQHDEPISTAIDLDGLIANHQLHFDYDHPPLRRHVETLDLPQLTGPGVWVVDLFGGGIRSRALVEKGRLIAIERVTDAGHLIQVTDGQGKPLPSAEVQFAGRRFAADRQGQIIVPFSESRGSRRILLVNDDFAQTHELLHEAETYELQAGFLVDPQALVAGRRASLLIRPRLTCSDQPVSLQLLDKPQLTVAAIDGDGLESRQSTTALELNDAEELVHTLLVPPRVTTLRLTLEATVFNQSRGVRQTVSVSHEVHCNRIQSTQQIADFYLRKTPSSYRLHVLGRNGEPINGMPVTIQLKLAPFTNLYQYVLTTNDEGEIDLGALSEVTRLTASASGIQSADFELRRFYRNWPSKLQLSTKDSIQLPLGTAESSSPYFTLYELRQGMPYASWSDKIQLRPGQLTVEGLPAGDYKLADYETGLQIRIAIEAGSTVRDFVVGPQRVLQTSTVHNLAIVDTKAGPERLVIHVDNADAATRVHVLGHPYLPAVKSAEHLNLPNPRLGRRVVELPRNHYVDSLRLDEEYDYILRRRQAERFPGNLLPQPSLLIHPWEIAVTDNQSQTARTGEALPSSPSLLQSEPGATESRRNLEESASSGFTSFDFLQRGSTLIANVAVVDGQASVPMEQLQGYSLLTIIAIHPHAHDSREVVLDDREPAHRDIRLQAALDTSPPLRQVQKVELISAAADTRLGDPRTSRTQIYGSISDVYHLYGTLLRNSEWEKFRFLTEWHELSDEDRATRYGEMACHELNFFLYHKSPEFFRRVVRPLLANKFDKQLIDHYLLDEPLAEYQQLWVLQRLNTLERILLATRTPDAQPAIARSLKDYVDANPLDPQQRQQRFQAALAAGLLEDEAMTHANDFSDSMYFAPADMDADGIRLPESLRSAIGEALTEEASVQNGAFGELRKSELKMERYNLGIERLGRRGEIQRLFEPLDQTREWAESQYYHVRLANQHPQLIPANLFWQEFLANEGQPFLPSHLELPCSSLHEALCALAVIDLPFEVSEQQSRVEDNELILESSGPAIVLTESVQAATPADTETSILLGHDIFPIEATAEEQTTKPVSHNRLLASTPYRAVVVVTNPGSESLPVQVLTQIPQGAIALQGGRVTKATALQLEPYSTSQVEYSFYFPVSGSFDHFGAHVNSAERHLRSTAASVLQVDDEPTTGDTQTWSYVADWGSNEEVLDYLRQANLAKVDLTRIAFRMQDESFFSAATELLAAAGAFEGALWGYAILHDIPQRIEELLHRQDAFIDRLGARLASPLLSVEPQEQMNFEHLDYKPLVQARTHQLGAQRVILNPSLHRQYHQLLDIIAHQPRIQPEQQLQLCYYLLLQNRIEEALTRFAAADESEIESQLQYDYFAAHLDFYRREYERAATIASQYVEHPIPRVREMFAQIAHQVSTRGALTEGATTELLNKNGLDEATQRLLSDGRESTLQSQASQAPAIELEAEGGGVAVRHRNLASVRVNYYLMDIELLFSRNPFVARTDASVPPIRPNLTESIKLSESGGPTQLPIPTELRNRNVLIEVTGDGVSRSQLLTSNALAVTKAEAFGRLQVLTRDGRQPVDDAYVKVFARHRDGQTRFYKDGYTDLRGQFDYVTLSTGELETVEQLAILILDPELGASVMEAAPPPR